MSKIEQQLTDFNLELAEEWRALQSHKYRRPKWIKFPRKILDDARWLRLSDKGKAAWMSILLIASERDNSDLPEPDLLYRRLHSHNLTRNRKIFTELINELIQCSFLLKITPELQSIRVTELQRPLLRKEPTCVGSINKNGSGNSEKRLGEKGRQENHYPSDDHTSPHAEHFRRAREMFGEDGASIVGKAIARGVADEDIRAVIDEMREYFGPIDEFAHALYLKALTMGVDSPAPPKRRCSALLTITDYLSRLAPELTREFG